MDELSHYGILGMKWGIRRTPEQLGHHKIKKGTKVYRATPESNESETGHAYVTYLPPDRDLYRGYFAQGLKNYRGLSEDSKLYENSYELKEDLNIPSRKEVQDIVLNLMKKEKARREAGEAFADRLLSQWDYWEDSEHKEIKKWYNKKGEYEEDLFLKGYEKAKKKKVNDFIKEIGNAPADMQFSAGTRVLGNSAWMRNQVISELKNRGYNAMVDEASVGGITNQREGVEPLIIFDRSQSMNKLGTREVSEKESKKASKRYRNWKWRANDERYKKNPW